MLFFFQAEDGIRDVAVTGVQTCALPILSGSSSRSKPMGASNGANARDHLLAVWGVQLTSRLSISVDDAPSSSAVVSCANRYASPTGLNRLRPIFPAVNVLLRLTRS